MQDDFPGGDPKTIWLNQPTEVSTMTLRKDSTEGAGAQCQDAPGVVGKHCDAGDCHRLLRLGRRPELTTRRCGGYSRWQLRGSWPDSIFCIAECGARRSAGDAAFSTGLEFYRREIERRRYLYGRVLPWSFGPVVLSVRRLDCDDRDDREQAESAPVRENRSRSSRCW